ncbi:MAG: VCBS repeat-containing protein [Bacteroidetes bacterium]|nr:VCBS repeat-containing protein [Bacteroidota bacterium]
MRTAIISLFLLLCTPLLYGQDSTWFRIITTDVGFGQDTKALRFNAMDLNGDHYPDIAVVRGTYKRGDMRVYMNEANQTVPPAPAPPRRFVDFTAASGVNAHPTLDTTKKVESISFGDADNDGDLDLINGVWMYNDNIPFREDRCEVLLNDGHGVFSHVADDGLESLTDPTDSQWAISSSGASWLDYDLDGILDVYVAAYWRTPNGPYHADRLMKGNGDGTFTDVSSQARVTTAYPMQGASCVDWNNDRWTDVLTSPYCRSNGSLLRNEGNGTFRDIAPMVGYNARTLQGDNGQNLCQWGAYPYDYDNDGDMDVLQVMVHGGLDAGEGRTVISVNQGAAGDYRLVQNLNLLHRSNPQSTHLGNMDAQWLDMNNDMLADVVITECEYIDATDRPYFYLQSAEHQFFDITPELNLIGKIRSAHSLEALDYDRDGDYDLVMNSNHFSAQGNTDRADIVFLENTIGNKNNWIGIQLTGPSGVNRAAIGARVIVHAGGVRQMREVHAGRGHFSGQQPLELLFGLGGNAQADSIIVLWPRQPFAHTLLTDVPANQYIDIDGSVLAADDLASAEDLALDFFPNPVRGRLRLQIAAPQDARVALYSPLGQRVYDGPASSQWIDVGSLRPGMYFLRLQSAAGILVRKVCVVR